MKKTFSTLEILNICAWYKQARENNKKPLNAFPLKFQWALKKNINILNPIAENFLTFREEAEDNIRKEFATDEKSYEETENDQAVRKVKDEYIAEFQNKVNELNQRLEDIAVEKNEVEISLANIEELIEAIEDTTDLTIDDIEILAFMGEA